MLVDNNLQDGKYAVSNDTLLEGYKIKKGHMMSYVPYFIGRRMKYFWGTNVDKFKPER